MSTNTPRDSETIPRNPFISPETRAIRRRVKVARFHYMSLADFLALSQADQQILTRDYQASLDAWLSEQNGPQEG